MLFHRSIAAGLPFPGSSLALKPGTYLLGEHDIDNLRGRGGRTRNVAVEMYARALLLLWVSRFVEAGVRAIREETTLEGFGESLVEREN